MDLLEHENKFQLLDTIGIPKNNLLFSSLNDILVYSICSNIIIYNLIKNTKTFLQYYYKSEISTFKFLDDKEQLLLIINKSSHPLLSIWKLPFLEEIFSQEIYFENALNFDDIYIEKLYSNLFILIISAIDCNFLYILKHENYANFRIEKIGKIQKISTSIEGFKCFYDDIYIIFIKSNNLLYYLIDPKKIFNGMKNDYDNTNQEVIKLHQKFSFPFKLKKNSLEISDKFSLVFFLTSKGNCLIYNKKGEAKNSINPLNKEENFTSIFLNENSLCLGTDKTKIYIYNITNNYNDNFKLKYFIKEQTLLNIKLNFQLNNNEDKNNINNNQLNNIIIEKINLNQKLDKIFIKLSNNSFIYVPLTSLMSDSRGDFYFNSLGNKSCLYSYNHYLPINDIQINNNYNEFETIIYTCSKDCTLIQYNIDFSTNKFSNLFFDLKDILKSKDNKYLNEMNNLYLTCIKFHPNDNTKLFAGDNKGYLYIFDIKENYFKYKKYFIDDNSIEFMSFSREGNLICLGLLTGKQVIYDINKNCEFCIKLNKDYLTQNEIDFRISNYHVITYNYFFAREKHQDCILFMKNTKKVEYSKLYFEKGKLNRKKIILNEFENEILDIKIHPSENYLIVLNEQNQILINEINLGETTAVIDLSEQINKIYNFYIDHSGLYLCIICSNYYSPYYNDLIFIEIGTGLLVSYIKCIGKVFRIFFDYYSKYIITGSHDGILSLWKIPNKMRNIMINVLAEIEKNENYWEQYEIKYYNNNSKNKYIDDDNEIEIPKKFKTEITRNNNNSLFNKSDEIEDNGPHKGIQTWQVNNYNNNNNDFHNNGININNSIKYKKKEINNSNDKNYTFQKKKNDLNDDNTNNHNTNLNNKDINENNISIKKSNIASYINNVDFNSYIPNSNSNITSNISNKTKKTKIHKETELDKNLKEENTLQNCYEKFKKERLMKNSFVKPTKNNTNKNINKNNNKVKARPLSSNRVISPNKKYLNQPIFEKEKEKYNKKLNDSIDFEIDFDLNKIRPNFDPNLYGEQENKKYSLISKELIKPYLMNKLSSKNDYLRHNINDYNKTSNNNNEYPNFNTSISNKMNNLNISNKYINKSNQTENDNKINNAMNILMEKSKSKIDNTERSNINNNKNNKSISSKDISHDFAFINNVRIEPSKLNNLSEEVTQKYNSNIISNENNNLNSLNKNIESLSTRKRNRINDNINNFENRLNYYGN